MRTSNPVLNAKTFSGVRGTVAQGVMSVQGTVNKTGLLLILLLASSSWVWGRTFAGAPAQGMIMVGLFGGLAAAFVTIVKKNGDED